MCSALCWFAALSGFLFSYSCWCHCCCCCCCNEKRSLSSFEIVFSPVFSELKSCSIGSSCCTTSFAIWNEIAINKTNLLTIKVTAKWNKMNGFAYAKLTLSHSSMSEWIFIFIIFWLDFTILYHPPTKRNSKRIIQYINNICFKHKEGAEKINIKSVNKKGQHHFYWWMKTDSTQWIQIVNACQSTNMAAKTKWNVSFSNDENYSMNLQ